MTLQVLGHQLVPTPRQARGGTNFPLSHGVYVREFPSSWSYFAPSQSMCRRPKRRRGRDLLLDASDVHVDSLVFRNRAGSVSTWQIPAFPTRDASLAEYWGVTRAPLSHDVNPWEPPPTQVLRHASDVPSPVGFGARAPVPARPQRLGPQIGESRDAQTRGRPSKRTNARPRLDMPPIAPILLCAPQWHARSGTSSS